MNAKTRQQIESLMSNPDSLIKKQPFFRELADRRGFLESSSFLGPTVSLTGTVTAQLPNLRKQIVPQSQYMMELNVNCHKVLFDDNIPSFTVKLNKGGYLEIEQYRIPVPFQEIILNKQVRHLCVNPIRHTLLILNPTEKEQADFIRIKQAWSEKNMEGAKTKFVKTQKSYSDGGLLFFINDDNKLTTKNISYDDGYVIITHKNDDGKHILECLYYAVTDSETNTTTTYIDCYDDEYMTRFTSAAEADGNVPTDSGWIRHAPVRHGFSECPLITKRGTVAWERGQRAIESYEALYNTILVIYKKFGRGIIYIKGKFNQNAKKIATNVVLNDISMDEKADAKVLEMPVPQQAIDMLKFMEHTIQKSCGTTFILPEDIKISGDTSGLAVELTQELDMATAQDGVTEWQNVANKMMRLFKEGLAIELVRSGENPTAMTDFEKLRIFSEFSVWKPKSEEAHNQMLASLYASGRGGISRQTFVEKNTVSAPDEMTRIMKEKKQQLAEEQNLAEQAAELEIKKIKAADETNKKQ